jgi:hypothetical protein
MAAGFADGWKKVVDAAMTPCFGGGCADMGDSIMEAWFRLDGHNREMHAWQHGVGWMELCEPYGHANMVWVG